MSTPQAWASDAHKYETVVPQDASGSADLPGDLNVDGDVSVGGSLIVAAQTPASAGAAGVAGTIAADDSYIYVCTATNTWKRVAIATWP